MAVILWRTREPSDSIKANLVLKFYLPSAKIYPCPLDVDGDGKPDMLAVHSSSDKLQLYDIRQFKQRSLGGAPKIPEVLYSIQPSTVEDPISMATGHVPTTGSNLEPAPSTDSSSSSLNETDRSRHFFCGKDWHDASAKCGQPCPRGTQVDCPDGETCFADTPCDSQKMKTQQNQKSKTYEGNLTPAGGIPGVFTLWSNGMLTMHALSSPEGSKSLVLEELWNTSVISGVTEWADTFVAYVDATDSSSPHGIVIVSAYVDQTHNDRTREVLLVAAVDALSGALVWSSLQEREEQDRIQELPLPMRGETSIARRRSNVPLQQQYSHANCLHSGYRGSVLNKLLPLSYFNENDTFSAVTHFTRQARSSPKHHKAGIEPTEGKPNVVVTYNQLGVQVRSLKNGRSICHVRLLDDTLYGDFNRDTIIDSLEYLVGDHEETNESNGKFINHIVQKFGRKIENAPIVASLCHAQARSGIPSREELFNTRLCNPIYNDAEISPGPPVAVEGLRGQDIVVSLNNGVVARISGRNGHVMWEIDGSKNTNFPQWEDHHRVLSGRISAPGMRSHSRPVILSGDNSIVLLSAKHGRILSTTAIPQPPTTRPLLSDWNGDGISDVLIVTQDAVWGYCSIVHVGSAVWFSLCSGFLILAMMLSLLKNRTSSHPGKRGTDA